MKRKRAWMWGVSFLFATPVLLVVVWLFLTWLLSGLGPGTQDFTASLAGEYSLMRTSVSEIQISPDIWNSETPIIPTKVVECAVYRNIILAKRVDVKAKITDYWVLDAAGPKVYGRLSLEQFAQVRRQLGVPDDVALRDVYEFRPWCRF